MGAANAAGVASLTSKPVRPSSTASRLPPTSVATTGSPAAMYAGNETAQLCQSRCFGGSATTPSTQWARWCLLIGWTQRTDAVSAGIPMTV